MRIYCVLREKYGINKIVKFNKRLEKKKEIL